MKANDRSVWWRAALRRDPEWDGAFVFAVTSTGVYCRASCPARRPRPEHVVLFRAAVEAEREGFRACRRCGSRNDGGVLRACEFIARSADQAVRLDQIARHVGWSPFHLQRMFRRRLGVTPGQYGRRLRFERFQSHSRKGATVTPALYAAGFGSSSRLYERSKIHLGMTPATCSKKGLGMDIAYDVVDCPLGRALIAATPMGLCSVKFGSSDRTLAADLKSQFPRARVQRDSRLLRFARERLDAIFSGSARDPRLPLDVRATAFQAQVWESLKSIPYGETRSYAEVARAIGRPRAVRAVARACATNPVALIIPCHRVVGSGGGLTGYRWGVDRKKALVALERTTSSPRGS